MEWTIGSFRLGLAHSHKLLTTVLKTSVPSGLGIPVLFKPCLCVLISRIPSLMVSPSPCL